jgi:predicted RNA-binding protein with PIN domain
MPYWFDGNNLIGQSASAARADSKTRRAFLSTLSTYQRSGGGKFLVYFDGDDACGGIAPPGVSIRYSAPVSTDEAILRRLKEIQHPSEIIVITNDRALRLQCRNSGASALTWEEFCSKMQSRSPRKSTKHNQEKPVDVDDWIRYFGLDRTKI